MLRSIGLSLVLITLMTSTRPCQGYQIKVLEDVYNYTYPIIGDTRIELNPTVPQWVIDMEVEMHLMT